MLLLPDSSLQLQGIAEQLRGLHSPPFIAAMEEERRQFAASLTKIPVVGTEEEESAQHLPNSEAADTVRDAVYQEAGAREVQGDGVAQACLCPSFMLFPHASPSILG